jgi:hypothetical protein
MTAKNELWMARKGEYGNDEVIYCSVFCREDLPPVVFYKN